MRVPAAPQEQRSAAKSPPLRTSPSILTGGARANPTLVRGMSQWYPSFAGLAAAKRPKQTKGPAHDGGKATMAVLHPDGACPLFLAARSQCYLLVPAPWGHEEVGWGTWW